jgi:DNA polymerase II small subunit
MNEKILDLVREKGLLVEKSIFDILNGLDDVVLAKNFLESLEKASGNKIINSTVLSKNFEYVKEVVNELPGKKKEGVEKIFVKMGLKFEVRKESVVKIGIEKTKGEKEKQENRHRMDYKVFYSDAGKGKKIEVKDFVGHFKARYQQLQSILMERQGFDDLISINKISGARQGVTIIGIVTEKRVTKNGNLIIKFEDLTGDINCLAKDGNESYLKARELQLDDVVAVKASGSNEMLFIQDVVYPDAFIFEKKKFNKDVCVAFISDIHVGSNNHLGKEFDNFLNWLNSDNELAKKIKYIFIVGDNVDGVGIFPGQERLLTLKSFKEQYKVLGNYLRRVPKKITMFMCPGQHDSVRVAEPQPVINNEWSEGLKRIDNLVLVSNPTNVNLVEGDKEFKVLMYHGASIHTFINEIEELRLKKAHRNPAKAVRHMLKRRHLAPTHSSVSYLPNPKKDPLVISEVPDVLCTGEVHRLDIENYNGVLIITGSCWQSQTEFEEKVGNVPDPCKVPILNLKTREVKVLDFNN